MLLGYACVSTTDQSPQLRLDALTATGCTTIFTDTISGTKRERPGLSEALSYVRPGGTLSRRYSRGLEAEPPPPLPATPHPDNHEAAQPGVGFKSLTENIDTTTSGGKLICHIFGALGEFERNIIRERTEAGLQAARARGHNGGRPKLLGPKKLAHAQALYNDKTNTIADICKTLGISRATLYRSIRVRREA
jgi:DNA invertase Pin-like site-specific DNA recombinase